jgi:hypothetical protein
MDVISAIATGNFVAAKGTPTAFSLFSFFFSLFLSSRALNDARPTTTLRK